MTAKHLRALSREVGTIIDSADDPTSHCLVTGFHGVSIFVQDMGQKMNDQKEVSPCPDRNTVSGLRMDLKNNVRAGRFQAHFLTNFYSNKVGNELTGNPRLQGSSLGLSRIICPSPIKEKSLLKSPIEC